MAPEMLIMQSQYAHEKKGYTAAVDYWSLGVTIFVLLTGSLPFKQNQVVDLFPDNSGSVTPVQHPLQQLHQLKSAGSLDGSGSVKDVSGSVKKITPTRSVREMAQATVQEGFERMRHIADHVCMSEEALSIVTALLHVNERKRLGSGPNAMKKLREHRFFADISWSLLQQKHMLPPHIPREVVTPDVPVYPTFNDMIHQLGLGVWLHDWPNAEGQSYYNNW